jgi:hypothetical protein
MRTLHCPKSDFLICYLVEAFLFLYSFVTYPIPPRISWWLSLPGDLCLPLKIPPNYNSPISEFMSLVSLFFKCLLCLQEYMFLYLKMESFEGSDRHFFIVLSWHTYPRNTFSYFFAGGGQWDDLHLNHADHFNFIYVLKYFYAPKCIL